MKLLIKNGLLLDPASGRDGYFDVLMEDGLITEVEECIHDATATVVDAAGSYVMPGFVDLHVHLREPGFEYKETVKSGTRAAARGGFTSVFAMPNTKPVLDSPKMIEKFMDIVKRDAIVNVFPVGAVTIGQLGEKETDVLGMVKAGAKAISEDGKSVMNTVVYRSAMLQAKEAGIPVFAHCEDITLVNGGVMNAGVQAKKLGMKGISNAVEDVITERDIILAKETGARLHLCHCSTADSVRLVKMARQQGLPVTAEVCPHHFALTEDDILEDDANYKMNPPLRSLTDVKALKEGIRDGIMSVIATDHAPHSKEEKERSISESPFGIVGLETALPISMLELVQVGCITLMELVRMLSYQPSKIANIDRGSLEVGKVADIIIVNLDTSYSIDKFSFASKGKNTPFHGRLVKGRVEKTFVAGNLVYDRKEGFCDK